MLINLDIIQYSYFVMICLLNLINMNEKINWIKTNKLSQSRIVIFDVYMFMKRSQVPVIVQL